MGRKKKKPENPEEVKKSELAVTIETLTLERLIEHYVHLRFYLWDGSHTVEHGKPYYVFEMVPEGDLKNATRKSTRFKTEEDANFYISTIRTKMKEQLLASLMGVVLTEEQQDGNVTEVSPSVSAVGPERESECDESFSAGILAPGT